LAPINVFASETTVAFNLAIIGGVKTIFSGATRT